MRYPLLTPVLIYLLLFVIFPTFYTWYMALSEYSLRGSHFIGLANFFKLAGDEVFLFSLRNTVYLTCGAVLLEFFLGFSIALILDKDFWGKPFVYWCMLLPMILPPVVVGLTFRILYDPSLGLINYIIGVLGFEGPRWLTTSYLAMPSIILIDVWQWTPFIALIMLSGLQYVPSEVKESAMVDGASTFQILRYITLPLMKNLIALALIFRTIDCFNKTFDIIFMTTRGGPGHVTETVPIYAYRTAFTYLKFGKAAAQGIVLTFVIMIFIILLRKISREELVT